MLAKVMRDHLNDWPDKPSDIQLEDFGRDTPAMMIQQLSHAEKKRAYINGSYIGTWAFAVYVRINAADTASRLDALKCLDDLYNWLDARDRNNHFVNLPSIDQKRVAIQVTMPDTPSVAAKYENGVEEYQAIMELEYKYSV